MTQATDPNVSDFYSYLVYPDPIQNRPTQPQILPEILRRAADVGSKGILIFDIDSTIYDNRPREVRILREFGANHGLPILAHCRTEHIQDRSLVRSMTHCGLAKEQAEALDIPVRNFWFDRFFTNEYCQEDRPIPGAAAYLDQVRKTQARIYYCTGRPLQMEEGTLACFQRDGFPMPDEKQVFLLMKPTFYMTDDESKLYFYQQLENKGPIVAAFDNEPLHINGYHQTFPEAISVHLLTEESGRGLSVLPTIPSIRNFIY